MRGDRSFLCFDSLEAEKGKFERCRRPVADAACGERVEQELAPTACMYIRASLYEHSTLDTRSEDVYTLAGNMRMLLAPDHGPGRTCRNPRLGLPDWSTRAARGDWF